MRFSSKKSRRGGFTLIELLVVIAIIAILAAILFPVFTSARESGRRARCVSNLKQLGLVIIQYTDDYNGFLPPFTSTAIPNSLALRNACQSYGQGPELWKCPSDRGHVYSDGRQVKPSFFAVEGSSYLYNGFIQAYVPPAGSPKKLASCSRPVELILFWDWVSHPIEGTWWQQTVFADGHVKHLNNQDLYTQATNTPAIW